MAEEDKVDIDPNPTSRREAQALAPESEIARLGREVKELSNQFGDMRERMSGVETDQKWFQWGMRWAISMAGAFILGFLIRAVFS